MSQLSNTIEEFIKSLMGEEGGPVELQRNELASFFGCAPSQINYVLATRFTLDKGYNIESRRGGGGYIRVVRIDLDDSQFIRRLISEQIGPAITEGRARQMVSRLAEMGTLTRRERALMETAMLDKCIMVPPPVRDAVRASLLRNMLACVITLAAEGGGSQ